MISLFCFGASFYQSFVLFDNFKSKDTLRKNTEVTYPDNYTTPMIIVCSDPGNQKPEEPLIELKNEADLSGLIPPVRVFRTMYKVFLEIKKSTIFASFKFRVYATSLIALLYQILFLMSARSFTSTLARHFYSTVCSLDRRCFCPFIIQLSPWKLKLLMEQTYINSV